MNSRYRQRQTFAVVNAGVRVSSMKVIANFLSTDLTVFLFFQHCGMPLTNYYKANVIDQSVAC